MATPQSGVEGQGGVYDYDLGSASIYAYRVWISCSPAPGGHCEPFSNSVEPSNIKAVLSNTGYVCGSGCVGMPTCVLCICLCVCAGFCFQLSIYNPLGWRSRKICGCPARPITKKNCWGSRAWDPKGCGSWFVANQPMALQWQGLLNEGLFHNRGVNPHQKQVYLLPSHTR